MESERTDADELTTWCEEDFYPDHLINEQEGQNEDNDQTECEESRDDEDVKMNFIIGPDELCRILECPVCYDVVLPPIFTCTSGHHICTNCRNSVVGCPVCRGEFSKERNLLMEKILDKCEFSCKFRNSGCMFESTATNLGAHLTACVYRPIRCIECDNSIAYDKFISHLLSRRTIERQDASEVKTGFEILPTDFNDEISKQVWEPTWIYTKGVNFFLNLENEKNAWWLWVSAFGVSEYELQAFSTDIYLWNSKAEIRLKYSGPVHCIRKSSEEVLKSGQCLSVLKETIQSLLNQGGIDSYVKIYDAPNPKIKSPLEKSEKQKNIELCEGVAEFVEAVVLQAVMHPVAQTPEFVTIPSESEEGMPSLGSPSFKRILPRKYMNPPSNYTTV